MFLAPVRMRPHPNKADTRHYARTVAGDRIERLLRPSEVHPPSPHSAHRTHGSGPLDQRQSHVDHRREATMDRDGAQQHGAGALCGARCDLGPRVGSVCCVSGRAGGYRSAGDKGIDSLLERGGFACRRGVYGVGDRIQLGTYRGVVLEYDVFATKLLEIGPGQTSHLYTGRTVVFPNSLLFGNPLIKESPSQEYGLYVLSVPLQSTDDWQAAEQALLNAAKVECASFMDQMGRQMKLLEQRNLLEAPSPEPRITIQLPEAGRIHLVLRFPAPDRGRSRVEQAILRRYLIAVRP